MLLRKKIFKAPVEEAAKNECRCPGAMVHKGGKAETKGAN